MKTFAYKTALVCCFFLLTFAHALYGQGKPDLVWMRGGSGGPPVYSPNGKYLISSNGSLQIRRVSDGLLLRDITMPYINGSPNPILTPAVSPDSQYIAAGCTDKSVRLWRISDGQQVLTFQSFASATVGTVAFSPDGTLLVGGSSDAGIYIWHVADGSQVRGLHDAPGAIKQIAFTPNGRYLVVSAIGGGGSIYNVSNWQPVSPPIVGTAFDISPDSKTLAMQLTYESGALFQIRLYNIPDLSFRGTIGSADGGDGVRFSPDGRRIAQGLGFGNPINIWNLSDGSAVSTINLSSSLPRPETHFPSFAFGPDSQTLLTSDIVGAMQEWRVSDGTATRAFTELPYPAEHITASPDGKLLAEVHNVGVHTLAVRRASDGVLLKSFIYTNYGEEYHNLNSPVFSTDGKYLVVDRLYDDGGRVQIYRTGDWSTFTLSNSGTARVDYVAFSPDGNYLAAAGANSQGNGTVSIWHLPDFTLRGSFNTPTPTGIAFSPNSRLLAVDWQQIDSRSNPSGTQFYNPINCQYVSGFDLHGAAVINPIFTLDGQSIIGMYAGRESVGIWNVPDGTLLQTIHHGQPVNSIALSPDGLVLATCGGTQLKFWPMQDGFPLLTCDQEINNTSIAYSADDKFLYHGRADGSVWQALNPYRNAVFPNHGGNTGNVTVKIITPDTFPLVNGTSVKLTADGQPDIVPISTAVDSNSPYVISATFALNGTTLGKRNVVITLPDGETRTYPQGFTIEQGVAPSLTTQVEGRSQIRGGAWTTYYVNVQNTGNIDANATDLRIEFPNYFEWKLGTGQAQGIFTGEHNTSISVGISMVPAASTATVPVLVKASDDPKYAHKMFQVEAWVNTGGFSITYIGDITEERRIQVLDGNNYTVDYFGEVQNGVVTGLRTMQFTSPTGYVLRSTLDSNALPTSIVGSDGYALMFDYSDPTQVWITPISPDPNIPPYKPIPYPLTQSVKPYPGGAPGGGGINICDLAAACKNHEFYLHEACAQAKQFLTGTGSGIVTFIGAALASDAKYASFAATRFWPAVTITYGVWLFDCYLIDPLLKYVCDYLDMKCRENITSGDPNEITGATGFDIPQWVSGQQPLPYTVFFANKPEATAPAAEVIVTDHLDATKLDMTTVNLQSITFAGQTVTPTLDVSLPVGKRQFNADVDLRPAKNLIVHINAVVDMLTGDLTWHFTSLDPVTMQPTQDPTAGFLDPGQEGSVLFSVLPKNTLPTGTVVTNQASIKFDFNAFIDTPVWFNTIDNDKPSSQVSKLAGMQSGLSFKVYWQGQDVGSGLRDFTIYVSDNGGAWTPWLTNIADTSATFTGVGGHTYAFASQARDNVFNLEDLHPLADTVTQVPNIASDVSSQVSVTRGGFRLNRATGRFVQTVTLTNTGSSAVTGPISLALDGLSGNAALFNKTSVTSATTPAGSPYLTVQAGDMAAGGSVMVTLEFTNSDSSKGITYITRVLAGTGSR